MGYFVRVLLVLICSQGHSQRGREAYAQAAIAEDVLEKSNLQFSINLYQVIPHFPAFSILIAVSICCMYVAFVFSF